MNLHYADLPSSVQFIETIYYVKRSIYLSYMLIKLSCSICGKLECNSNEEHNSIFVYLQQNLYIFKYKLPFEKKK